jgi:hypothetical protein
MHELHRSGHGGSVQPMGACQEDSDSASMSVQPMEPQNVTMILYPLIAFGNFDYWRSPCTPSVRNYPAFCVWLKSNFLNFDQTYW